MTPVPLAEVRLCYRHHGSALHWLDLVYRGLTRFHEALEGMPPIAQLTARLPESRIGFSAMSPSCGE